MNSGSLTLRFELKPGEDKRIREITESVGVFYEHETDIAEELARESIEKGADRSGYNYILCKCDSQIVGYTCYGEIPCTRDRYDLYWIVVHNSYRKMNIGKMLMHATEEEISKRGGKKIYIETSSREPYYYARKLYLNCCYRQEAVFKDYYDDGDDKIVYVKDL